MISTLNFVLKAAMYVTGITLCVCLCVAVVVLIIGLIKEVILDKPENRYSRWD